MLRRDFETEGARTFSDSQWLRQTQISVLHKLETTTSCMFAPSTGHSGGDLINPELLNHLAIPPRWKEYLYTVGLIAGGNDTKEGRQTVFFTALDPTGDETQEEYDDFTKPRIVQYKNKWNNSQHAI